MYPPKDKTEPSKETHGGSVPEKHRVSAQRTRRILRPSCRERAVSLIEVLVASTILLAVCLSVMGALFFNRVQSRKAMEHDIMQDFVHHYLELARAQQYDLIAPGAPINALYDGNRTVVLPSGAAGTINVRFPPSDGAWRTLWTNDFRNFHPDLEWFEGREPSYLCTINTQTTTGLVIPRVRQVRLEVRWRPPLRRGSDWNSVDAQTSIYSEFN